MEQSNILRFILISLVVIITSEIKEEQANICKNHSQIERIINGHESQNCQFSGIVHINGAKGFQCAGNLVDRNYVLSAAHCVSKHSRTLDLSISMGSTTRSRATTNRHVSQIIIHDDFQHDYANYYNDIALLKMSDSVTYGPCLQSVKLPGAKDIYNRSCIAAGWGRTFHKTMENELQYVTLPLLNNILCLKDRMKSGHLVKPYHLCAGKLGRGGGSTCYGDSGGPLYCSNQNNELALLGITSFGDKDCSRGTSYYTSVYFFLDWIYKKIEGNK